MNKPKSQSYFRDKRLAPRQKFSQKYLRPLAAWIESKSPVNVLIDGFLIAAFWISVRLAVIHFYGFMEALPWMIVAIALSLAGASWALRRGRSDGSPD